MRVMKIALIKQTLRNGVWKEGILFKPPIFAKMKIFAGKHFNTNFPRNFHSATSFRDNTSSEVNSKSRFEPPVDIGKITELSDDELKKIISQTCELYSSNYLHFKDDQDCKRFLNILDDECVRRSKGWDLDTTLNILNEFHPHAKVMCINFLFLLVKKKYRKALNSPVPITMKYLSALNSYKFWRKYFMNPYLLEEYLVRNFDQLTTDEISTFLTAFSNLKAGVNNPPLMKKLKDKLMDETESSDPSILCRFLKFFSHQIRYYPNCVKFTSDQLIDFLQPDYQKYSSEIARYVASICTTQQIYNPEILDKMAEKLEKQMPDLNAAHLQDILNILVHFNYSSRDIYRKVVDNFQVEPFQSNLDEHPKRLVKILGLLTLVGVYPFEYINKALSLEFLRQTFAKKLTPQNVLRDVMVINEGVQLECPDYKGNKLDSTLRQKLLSYWSSRIPNYLAIENVAVSESVDVIAQEKVDCEPSPYNKTVLGMRTVLTSFLGGPEFIHTCYVLPFLPRPNLIFALDRKRNPVKLPNYIVDSIRTDCNLLDKNLSWYVALSAARNPIVEGDIPLIKGKDVVKVRILKKLGCNLIIVVEEVWLSMNREAQSDYLKQFLN